MAEESLMAAEKDTLAANLTTGAGRRKRFNMYSERMRPSYDPPTCRTSRTDNRRDDPSHPEFNLSDDAALQQDPVLSLARQAYAVAVELLDTIHITGVSAAVGASTRTLT